MLARGRELSGSEQEHPLAAIGKLQPQEGDIGKLGLQRRLAVADLGNQDPARFEMRRGLCQDTHHEIEAIRAEVARYTIEGDLRRTVSMNIKRLMDINSYRGLRHKRGLPVRGQRTHTNARSRKGKRTAIAGKKKVGK